MNEHADWYKTALEHIGATCPGRSADVAKAALRDAAHSSIVNADRPLEEHYRLALTLIGDSCSGRAVDIAQTALSTAPPRAADTTTEETPP